MQVRAQGDPYETERSSLKFYYLFALEIETSKYLAN